MGELNEFLELLGPSPVVHEATGMISVQIGGTMRDAADRLIAESTAAGEPVESVAISVVERHRRFD